MIDDKHNDLILYLLSLLNDEEKLMYRQITDYLLELGYIPQKLKVQGYMLSFKNNKSKKVIAKIGIRNGKTQRVYFSMRFFACKSFSKKFHDAIQHEIESHNGQYCTQKSSDILGKTESLYEKNKCGRCDLCTGGGLGYYYVYPDGREVVRCGAYPIIIPNLAVTDIDEVKRLLLEQHNYFLTIA